MGSIIKFFEILCQVSFSSLSRHGREEGASRMLSELAMRELEQGIAAAITKTTEDYPDIAEEQRKILGRSLGKVSEVSFHSHMVFWHLGRGEVTEAEEQCWFADETYKELVRMVDPTEEQGGPGIAGIYSKEMLNDAGQELVECVYGIWLYPVLIGEKKADTLNLPDHRVLDVTRQALLAGVADVSSEMSKLTKAIYIYQVRLGKLDVSKEDLLGNALAIGQGVAISFQRVGYVYPKLLNATTRFRQGFSTKKRLVHGSIFFTQKDFFDLPEGDELEDEE